MLSSGYYASSTNRVQSQLDTPLIVDIENPMTAQLSLRLTPVTNAKSYQVQISAMAARSGRKRASTRRHAASVLGGLTPGTTYSVRVRAIGGSTGYSDWSIPASLMIT